MNGLLLHYAVANANINEIKKLLELGVNPNTPDDEGMTSLHVAVDFGWNSIVELLLRCGAKSDVIALSGMTPLSIAVVRSYNTLIEILVSNGADLFYLQDDYLSYLDIAYREKSFISAVCLQKIGLSVEKSFYASVSDQASSWLKHTAYALDYAYNGDTEGLKRLLDAGLDPNTAGEGMYPDPILISAIRRCDSEMVCLLLERGADPNSFSRTPHWSALRIAKIVRSEEISQLLRSFGAIDLK